MPLTAVTPSAGVKIRECPGLRERCVHYSLRFNLQGC
jgi:hypothetical protein